MFDAAFVFLALFPRMTRFAGLSRAAAYALRSSSVAPFLHVISVTSVLSVI